MNDFSARVRASIVTYRTDRDELRRCVDSLHAAGVTDVAIVDNSPDDTLRDFCTELGTDYSRPGRNLGYGAAHNIELRRSLAHPEVDYHLVINSDVHFPPEVIGRIVSHMDSNEDIGQLIPRTVYPDGREQEVVRMLPTPLDVIFRRFLPDWLTAKRNHRYLLAFRDHTKEINVPYHQGSFIFLRTDALRQTGLFDERFFMYPEDIDLTRRMHRHFRTVFWPGATIVHAHRAASYRSFRMLRIHSVNMIRYFNKWGWIFDSERKTFNRRLMVEIGQ